MVGSPVNSPTPGIAALPTDEMGGSLIQDLALEQVSAQHPGRRLRTGHQKVEHRKQVKINGTVSRPGSGSRSPESLVHAGRKAVLTSEAVAPRSEGHRASRR